MRGPEPHCACPWEIVEARTAQQLLDASQLFDDPLTQESAADSLARPGHHLLLAITPDGEAIGFISGVEMRHPDKAAEMFINELGVSAAWRRRGIGRALLRALAGVARTRGIHTLWSATEPDNHAALATYRSMGAQAEEVAVMINIRLAQETA